MTCESNKQKDIYTIQNRFQKAPRNILETDIHTGTQSQEIPPS